MNTFQPRPSILAPSGTLRWQVVPATLSVALGAILLAMNCIHLRDAMIPEIARAFDPATNFTVAHGVMCIIASTLFFAASACAFLAARKWIASEYGSAIAFNIGTPALIMFGVILAYMQI